MIAITGGKGGCGKTTVTLGIGLALVSLGRRPLLVDADVAMPDLHIRTDVDATPGLAAVEPGRPPDRLAQSSPTLPGVDVLPAGDALTVPTAVLDSVSSLTRPVIVDCPAGASPDATAPLRVADACVVVTTTDAESSEDAAKSTDMATSLGTPVVATVQRHTAREASAGDGDQATGSPASGASTLEYGTTVSVPTVGGAPLDDERVLDPLSAIARSIWVDEHDAPATRGSAERAGRDPRTGRKI